LHREPPTPPEPPAPEPYFDWRNKTVLERFAHFFPERVAAHGGDPAAAHAAWAAETEAEWARVRAARANARSPQAEPPDA
jgi:hypothetical protein